MSEEKDINEDINLKCNRKNEKRKDYIGWEEYFMGLACLAARRSNNPMIQVGACIVNEDKRIVGIGYNGVSNGYDTSQQNSESHAEINAILNKNCNDLMGCSMYVNIYPCDECMKIIIQSGIKSVIYLSDKYAEKRSTQTGEIMFGTNFVCRQYSLEKKEITIKFQ